jgi:DNA-binding Lrp family transcriptional regulator
MKMDELSRKILEFLAQNGERVVGEILAAVKDLAPDRERVRYRLLTLAADGYVERRKITSKLSLWKITEKGKEALEQQQ